MGQIIGIIVSGSAGLVLYLALLSAAEALWPRGGTMPLVSRLRAIVFDLVYLVLAAILMFGWVQLFPKRFPPIIELPAPLAIPLAILAADFAYYWIHRAQHRFAILWRFHRVHHSVEHMGPGAGYHHFSQVVFDTLTFTTIMSLFIPPAWAGIVATLLGAHGFYIHSATALHIGPLNRFIQDNRTHRIHHSLEPKHFGKNFGIPTLVWDRVFGTAWLPAPDEWPATGLADYPELTSVGQFITASDRSANRAGMVGNGRPRQPAEE